MNFSPTPQFLKEYYSEDYFKDNGEGEGYSDYERDAKGLYPTFRRRAEYLKRFKKGGLLLDIGCATGAFLEVASNYWNVSGAEISAYAASVARSKGFCVYEGDSSVAAPRVATPQVASLPRNDNWDIITMWDVIEHVPDPLKTMRDVHSLLKPGGIVALSTGDVGSLVARLSGKRWHLYHIPQHLSYFNRQTVRKLMEEAGFSLKEIRYPSLHFTIDYLLFRFITTYRLQFALPWYRKISHYRALQLPLKINLYDIMEIIAEKR